MIVKKDKVLNFTDGSVNFQFQIKLSENRWQDENGFLYCDNAILGHIGVQEYYADEIGMDGGKRIIKVHRLPEDIFEDEAMASIEGKSVTRLHPNEPVTSKNAKYYDVGTILKAWRDGDNVVGKIVIKDADTIMDIIDGTMEALSLGYRAKLVEFGDGDYKQTNLVINHVAVVRQGRAVNARIMDESLNPKKEKRNMGLLNLFKGQKFRVNDDDTLEIVDSVETKDEKNINDAIYKTERKTVITENDSYDDENGESITKRVEESESKRTIEQTKKDEKTQVSDEEKLDLENKEKENKEKEELIMKDEILKEVNETFKTFKDEMFSALKEEFGKAKKGEESVFGKIEVLDSQEHQDSKPEDNLVLNFERDEKLRKAFYDKLTNPMAHGGDFKALNDFRKKAQSYEMLG